MLRLVSLQLAVLSLLALSGCAGQHNQSEDAAARAACQERGAVDAGDMDRCIEEMRSALDHSRVPPPPPPRVPPPPAHPSN